jgi:uncharacterized RDD family membrane protein YckC
MEYEDTRTIATPEGVELELPLAGLGSRFAAGLVDFALKAAIVVAVVLLAELVAGGTATLIGFLATLFFATVVYDVLFEVLGGGRTPGKRAVGLRVVDAGGGPVGLRTSAVRNLLRLVEGLPLSYAPAIASILLTRDNQRLGDLAAGTLVVREPRGAAGPSFDAPRSSAERLADWDVSAVTPQELAAVRSFLGRRHDFEPEARRALARRLAEGLAARVGGAPPGLPPERFLEDVARAKASRAQGTGR